MIDEEYFWLGNLYMIVALSMAFFGFIFVHAGVTAGADVGRIISYVLALAFDLASLVFVGLGGREWVKGF